MIKKNNGQVGKKMGLFDRLKQLKYRYRNNKGIVQGLDMAMDTIRESRGHGFSKIKSYEEPKDVIKVTSQDIVTLNQLKKNALRDGKDERAAFYHKLREVAKQYKNNGK